ncbi:CD209 antigen-like protein C [Lepisosteus oculatus]|uniref:CD209 antigen-like protein C n=1 Tax=Lepisosteus oculatus TaxID=7918 RepID=UPI00371B519C
MSEDVCYSTVTFSKSPSRGTHVKQDEVTYAEVKTARAPSAKTAPPPGAPVKAQLSPTPYRLAAVCLGLLCAVLLIAIIALSIYYNGSSQKLTKELVQLRENYSNLTTAKNKLQVDFRNLFTGYSNLTESNDYLTTVNHRLQVDIRNLTTSYSNLTVMKDNLQKERDNLEYMIIRLNEECRFCPQGWELFNSKCYFFSTDELSWTESRTACRKLHLGADLVIINSREEQVFIYKHTQGREHWLGISDAAAERTWIWVDNTRLTEGYWASSQPDNFFNEDCGATSARSGTLNNWNDVKCAKKMLWICEGSSLPLSP